MILPLVEILVRLQAIDKNIQMLEENLADDIWHNNN